MQLCDEQQPCLGCRISAETLPGLCTLVHVFLPGMCVVRHNRGAAAMLQPASGLDCCFCTLIALPDGTSTQLGCSCVHGQKCVETAWRPAGPCLNQRLSCVALLPVTTIVARSALSCSMLLLLHQFLRSGVAPNPNVMYYVVVHFTSPAAEQHSSVWGRCVCRTPWSPGWCATCLVHIVSCTVKHVVGATLGVLAGVATVGPRHAA